MIEKYIRDHLRNSSNVRDHVDGRIYATNAPQGIMGEIILIQEITSEHNNHLTGEAAPRTSVVQISCYAENPPRAAALAEAVRNRLSGYRGNMGQSNETWVSCCIPTNSNANSESPQDSTDKWVHSYITDYEVTWSTSVPTLT